LGRRSSSVIAGLALLIIANNDMALRLIGVGSLFGGSFSSWVSSCLIYGFGELIEATKNNVKSDKAINYKKTIDDSFNPLTHYRCICTKINELSSENCFSCGRRTKVVLDIQNK
jgi:hypothetical protein